MVDILNYDNLKCCMLQYHTHLLFFAIVLTRDGSGQFWVEAREFRVHQLRRAGEPPPSHILRIQGPKTYWVRFWVLVSTRGNPMEIQNISF